jgi:hypothetical protein
MAITMRSKRTKCDLKPKADPHSGTNRKRAKKGGKEKSG